MYIGYTFTAKYCEVLTATGSPAALGCGVTASLSLVCWSDWKKKRGYGKGCEVSRPTTSVRQEVCRWEMGLAAGLEATALKIAAHEEIFSTRSVSSIVGWERGGLNSISVSV